MDAETKTITGLIFEPGVVIANRYEVCERLGAGGVGMVYKAIDRELDGEVVALKLLLPHLAQDETVFRRFRNEVLVARALSHPNIVRTHDMGRAEGGYSYISMEFVDGVSLKDKLSTKFPDGTVRPSLSFDEALAILYQIISGVSYAHGKGVIHRDLKPANVLISKAGEVKLADFGTARIMGMDTSLTQTGQVIGTPDYMSPEQIRGEQLDPSCDIYALGIMAYELMVGMRPFTADSSVAVAFKHLNDPIPSFASAERGIPLWFEEVVRKAAAKKKGDRFSSVMELAATLLDYAPQLSVQSTFFSVSRKGTGGSQGTSTPVPDTTPSGANGAKQPRDSKKVPRAGESADFRFELGATSAQPEEEGWRLGSSQSMESGDLPTPRDGASMPMRILGLVLGALTALIIVLAVATRVSGSFGTFVGAELSGMASSNPTLARALGAFFGVRVEASPVKVASTGPTPKEPTPAEPDKPADRKAREELERELGGLANSVSQTENTSPEVKIPVENKQPETKQPDTKQTETKSPEPEKTPVAAQPTPEPTKVVEKAPEPTPVALAFSGSLGIREGTRAIQDDSISVDRLGSLRWFAPLAITGDLPSDYTADKAREDFALNVFDLRKASVVAKLRPEQVQLPTAQEPALRITGSFNALRATNPSAGSFRLDLVRSGEVLSSRDLVLYRASFSTTTQPQDTRVTIVRGVGVTGVPTEAPTAAPVTPQVQPVQPVQPELPTAPVNTSGTTGTAPNDPTTGVSSGGLPIARGLDAPPTPVAPTQLSTGGIEAPPPDAGLNQPPAATESYGGFLRIPGGEGVPEEKRAMILSIEIRGAEVSGSATIAGYDPFQVTGRMVTRGMELELRNGTQWIRLTTGRRDRTLRGLYSFPAIGKKGGWEVTRTN